MRATVGLFVVVCFVIWKVYGLAADSNDGLCSIKTDAQARVQQTEQFIQEHPKGFSGISAAQLQRSVDAAKRTVTALDNVDCPPPVVLEQPPSK